AFPFMRSTRRNMTLKPSTFPSCKPKNPVLLPLLLWRRGLGRGGLNTMLWLQLRNELWKLFGKKRTYIGSGMFFLAQSLGILLFQFGQGLYRALVQDLNRLGFSAD